MGDKCKNCEKDGWLFETHFTPADAAATDATLAAAALTADISRLSSRITAVCGSRVSHNYSLSWKRYNKRVFLGHFLSSNYKVQCNYLTELLLVTAVWAQFSITEDGRSMSVFSLYSQLSQGRMAYFPAFIASKSFDLWNHHIGMYLKWNDIICGTFWCIEKKFYDNFENVFLRK